MIVVIADDFSGAAEVAGAAHAMGLTSEVQTDFHASSSTDVVVVDTNTRSKSPTIAAKLVGELTRIIHASHPTWLFKKIDSVLRGSVANELLSIADCWPFESILLVPANPSRNRTVVAGEIWVDGIPVARTPFAIDPEHPALSSNVIELLHLDKKQASVGSPDENLPNTKLIVGNASSTADLEYWSGQVDQRSLAAGGVEFFEATLRVHFGGLLRHAAPIRTPQPTVPLTQAALIVCGTSAGWQDRIECFERLDIPLVDMQEIGMNRCCTSTELDLMSARVAQQFDRHRIVAVAVSSVPLPATTLGNFGSTNLAELVRRVKNELTIGSMFIEGGATASAIVRASDWKTLTVVDRLAPGIVSLVPRNNDQLIVTVKPGSYPWPSSVLKMFSRN